MGKESNETDSSVQSIVSEDTIDLYEISKIIWKGKKILAKSVTVFFLFGIVMAFGSKVEYEALCKLMPESQEGLKPNLGGLGSLAGIAGINLEMGSSGALTPKLYPQVAHSVPFLLKVLDEPIHFSKHDTVTTSYNYFNEIDRPSFVSYIFKYTIGLPGQIRMLFTRSNPVYQIDKKEDQNDVIRLSKEDHNLLNGFRTKISVEVDNTTGIIKIAATMPDPVAAAEITKLCVDVLTEYITSYKTEKAKRNLLFIQERFSESKIKFEVSQKKLADFNDRNINVITSTAKTESQRLQNEYNINFEVYKGLATQLEQAKIKVKEETPVFTILEPVRVPVYKSNPNRKLIAAISISLGLLVGMAIIGVKHIIRMKTNE